MDKYGQSAMDAHTAGRKAAESSRQHSRDLERMVRSGENARVMLTDGRERQRKREEKKSLPAVEGTGPEEEDA